MKRKLLATLCVSAMVLGLVGCGGAPASSGNDATGGDTSAAGDAAPAGDAASGLITVGVINNDPNESGYRTANVNDMKEMFCEANGYDAQFAYSLKNDEQIKAAQKMIQDGVDYLLLSAADTSGWDGVLKDAKDNGTCSVRFLSCE